MTKGLTYPGGKAGAGVYQQIICSIPPHVMYIETHLGGGAIMRHKRPASSSIGLDLSEEVINRKIEIPSLQVYKMDAISFLENHFFVGDEFVYCDPPYLPDVLSDSKRLRGLYKYKYSKEDHIELLKCILKLRCKVMISGYDNELYNNLLKGWSTKVFKSMTRGGTRLEKIWMNYPEPIALHDYRYLGDNFRERQRIKRKKERWVNKLSQMPLLEKQALYSAIVENMKGIQ